MKSVHRGVRAAGPGVEVLRSVAGVGFALSHRPLPAAGVRGEVGNRVASIAGGREPDTGVASSGESPVRTWEIILHHIILHNQV